MIELSIFSMVLLCTLVFLAGFVDSIAGGGGLISLTSYYAVGLPPIYALGNNKFSSTFGTMFALGVYKKNNSVNFKLGLFTAIFSFIGSLLGSQLAIRYSDQLFKYFMLIIVPFVAILTIKKPQLENQKQLSKTAIYIICVVMGLLIGCYDGFFGPGTGLFLTLGFTSIIGSSTLEACGNTKLVNFASNIAALVSFISNGTILYSIALPCLIASILGNILGSTTAVKGGGKIVRPMMIIVLLLLFIKIIVDLV